MARGIKPGAVRLSYIFDLPEKMFLVLPSPCCRTVFTVGRSPALRAHGGKGVGHLVSPAGAAAVAAAGAAFIAGLCS